MSNKFRNPFKLRASEKIESDVGFLRLFSHHILEALLEKHLSGKLWDNVLFIHSSPGGGKSSLLRIFEPDSLNTIFNSKSALEYKPLYSALKKIDVINDDKVKLLGVSLSCTRNYQLLEELNLSDAQKKRLFFSLLNSRIILACLRAACRFTSKKFPNDLNKFNFNYDNSENYFKSIEMPCNGKALYDWASDIEKKIYNFADSFLPTMDNSIEGHDELISLLVLKPENLTLKGGAICSKILFMFDDAHKLSYSQRNAFKTYILEKRSFFNVWISERLEALEPKDHIGSSKERDFEVLSLENFWKKNQSKFDKTLRSISQKRASISTEEVTSFQEYLSEHLDEENIKTKLESIVKETEKNLLEIKEYTNKFDNWIDYLIAQEINLYNKAILSIETEILVHRNIGTSQLSFDFPLTIDELNQKKSSDVTNAAILFMSVDHKLPYYYKFNSLIKASSYNVEQFLSFGAELFEEMISNKLKRNEITLSDEAQDKIFKKAARKKWDRLKTEIPYSNQVINFLSALMKFSKEQTFKKNAPYSPGVNGFAIKIINRKQLFDELPWLEDEIFQPLVNVISTCVAYNLLEKHKTNQGKKGQSWDVYYLNRWLCVFSDLPLSYGGWRHQTPKQLINWIKK